MGRRKLSEQEKVERVIRERDRGRQRRLNARQNTKTHNTDIRPHHTTTPTTNAPIEIISEDTEVLNLLASETTLRTDTSPRPEAPLRSIDEQASSLPCLNPIRVSVVCGATLTSGQIATGEDEVEETLPAVEAPESHAFPQYDHDEGNSIRPGRPQIDPAVSPRERTRVRVQRHRDQQHPTRAQQIVQWFADSQDPPPTLEFSALTLRDGPAPSSVPDEAVEDGEGDDGSESFGFDNDVALGPTSPTPPAPPASTRRDSQPPQHRISLPSTPTFPVSPDAAAVSSSLGSDDPVLSGFLEAIRQQDTAGGPDFLLAQSEAYDQILRKFFSHQCDCPEPRAREEPEHTSTLPEYVQHISRALPPLTTVFAGRDEACDPRASFSQWQSFLSDQPAEPLSFRKTQASLSQDAVTIARQWDVDSVWFGARSLSAIRAPNQFRLSFFSPHTSNISTAQVIQPHGLDLAHTRHTIIGTFTTAGVRFSVLMFFPSGAPSQTRASTNSLSLARFRDLYDEIILPAVRETVPIHVRQEIPGSYDLIYAKSRAYQEKPGGRWSAEDESRSYRLAYGIPASVLPQFWAAVAHDLKNMFASESLQDSLCLFRDSILAGLDPSQIDMHSCWLDVGMRDHVLMPPTSSNSESQNHHHHEPWTLLWKSDCCRHLHDQVVGVAPEAPMEATYYRPYLLRDIGGYYVRAKSTRKSNPGHPEARSPGVIRAKAYNCSKELFGVMFSDYQLFSSGFLPLLAFDEGMLKDLAATDQSRQRAFVSQLSRSRILDAWDANKRHMRAVSSLKRQSDFGIRKEVTLRLDVILAMWVGGAEGLGLGDSIRTSGTLWIPDGHINWQTGHISLELLVNIYMSRSPLQAKLAHQANVQALATNQVTIELLFQRLVRNARAEYDRGRNGDAEILADRAVALAVEEIARAYHQHFLAKLHSYWDRLRGKVGRQKLPVLDMLQQAQEESAAETGRIPTAQAVHGIYAEAWDKYRQVTADDDSNGDINTSSSSLRSALPEELPCWMNTRRRLPPKNSWSAFLFDQIFCRPKPPTWNALFFLQLYRGFKKFWQDTCAQLGPFDGRFSRQSG
ncbi:hypothetical protein Forpe1208_v017241 [Fusarium oxysporum f. sp. rapae]|uniref:Uncharacterized protein n=1 Tax=Fusarium oxysporum f. sp. rapae TaxID=485398 RepID=A0A8J5NFI6_FUSOX|nr:hypothetical protein Forpe1208_v017241 [Fusarium oxysporum f. sp. rapae]